MDDAPAKAELPPASAKAERKAEQFPPPPATEVPVHAGMLNTVCPLGGFHEFEPVKGEGDFVAGIVSGALSTCLFCIWWPLLLCAPACYFGGREISKDVADKKCCKCALLVDRKGNMKEAPCNVPDKNPVSGQPNAFYGWSKAPKEE